MKILIISPNLHFGGASTANRNIATMLSKAGHEVVYADEFLKDSGESDYIYSDLPVYRNRITKKYKIIDHIRKNGYDMVICGMPQMMAFYLLHLLYLRIFHKVRLGIIFHSLCVAKDLKGRVFEYMIALSTIIVHKLFYVSEYTKKSWEEYALVRMSSAKPYIIHNAVPGVGIKHAPAARPRIAFVGRLSSEKRPQLFCSYAEALCDRYKFVVWGDGPMADHLREEYGSMVTFMGYENAPEKIYAQIDILMMTSEFENCPMVILESRTYGVPVITVNVGGISEILKEGYNGLYFKDTDSFTDLQSKIEDIISSYSTYQENCLNSVITLENSSVLWDKAVKSTK